MRPQTPGLRIDLRAPFSSLTLTLIYPCYVFLPQEALSSFSVLVDSYLASQKSEGIRVALQKAIKQLVSGVSRFLHQGWQLGLTHSCPPLSPPLCFGMLAII